MANAHSADLKEHVGHHDHAHDHDEHEESFVSKYIFSMDHKMISRQFLIKMKINTIKKMTMEKELFLAVFVFGNIRSIFFLLFVIL